MRGLFLALLGSTFAACSAPRWTLPPNATVYIAAPVPPPGLGEGPARDCVRELDRALRESLDLPHAKSADRADFVVQPLVSHASIDVTESKFVGHALIVNWTRSLVATVVVTGKAQPMDPRAVPLRIRSTDDGLYDSNTPIPGLLPRLRGCSIDPFTGAIRGRDGRPAWIGDRFQRLTLPWDEERELLDRIGLPTRRPPSRLPALPTVRGLQDIAEPLRALVDRQALDNSGPGVPSPFHSCLIPALMALSDREELRELDLDDADRARFTTLTELRLRDYGQDGPWQEHESAERLVALTRLLLARLRDDFDEYRARYDALLQAGIEPAFCRVVNERWPPDPKVFRHAYAKPANPFTPAARASGGS